jgi:hypothetical protein
VVGCLRRVRGWALSSVFAEYLLYAAPKTRLEDQQCIEHFCPANLGISLGPALQESSGMETKTVDENAELLEQVPLEDASHLLLT